MNKMRRSRRKTIGLLIALLCLAGIFTLAITVGADWLDGQKSAKTEAETRALYATPTAPPTAEPDAKEPVDAAITPSGTQAASPTPQPSPTPTPTVDPATLYAPGLPPVETPPPVQDDFQELYTKNEHVIGWLTAGERIDYPVVWYENDNEYYLHHDFFGGTDANGTLFLNGNNRFFPKNDVWLIHGHNMRSGAMFGTLCKYRKYDYLCQYPLITFRTIYDPEMVYYVPIAAFDASMVKGYRGYFDVTQFEFPDDRETDEAPAQASARVAASPAEYAPSATPASTVRQSAAFTAYLKSLRKVSLWESPADVNVDDSLLMLITCSYTLEDGRFMLVCRKLRLDETPEDILALFEEE